MAGRLETGSIPRMRLTITYAILAVVTVLFIGRLYTLQIIEGESYRLAADENRFDEVNVPAPRGVIYDRNVAGIQQGLAPSLYNESRRQTKHLEDQTKHLENIETSTRRQPPLFRPPDDPVARSPPGAEPAPAACG